MKNYKKILILVGFAVLFSSCSGRNEVNLSGSVEATQYEVRSEVGGKIIKVLKEEGALVKANDVIAEVDATIQAYTVRQQAEVYKAKEAKAEEVKKGTREEQIRQAEAAVTSAKARLDEVLSGTRSESIKQMTAQRDASKAAVQTAQKNFDISKINEKYLLDKYKKIAEQYEKLQVSQEEMSDAGYKYTTANQQANAAFEQVEVAKAQERAVEAQVELLRNGNTAETVTSAKAVYQQALAQRDLLKNGATQEAIKMAEAEKQQAKAQLEQSKAIFDKYRIKAPADGILVLRSIDLGDMVNVGSGIGKVSNLKDMWAKVFIPQKNIHQVTLNQLIELTTPSLGTTKIKGKIVYIADEAEFTPKNIQTDEEKENTVFKVKIKIQDHIDEIKPGMTLHTVIR